MTKKHLLLLTGLFFLFLVPSSKISINHSQLVVAQDDAVISTKDGLLLSISRQTGQITGIKADGKLLPTTQSSQAQSGFSLENLFSDEHVRFQVETIEQKEQSWIIKLKTDQGFTQETEYIPHGSYIEVKATLFKQFQDDAAVRAHFALPINALNWLWHDDINTFRTIEGAADFENVHGTFQSSQYPFSSIYSPDLNINLSLAVPMDQPIFYNIIYETQEGLFDLSFPLALSSQTLKFPNKASFRFILYKNDPPEWGFRAAADKYYKIFPEYFVKRIRGQEGEWNFYQWTKYEDQIPGLIDHLIQTFGIKYFEGDFYSSTGIKKAQEKIESHGGGIIFPYKRPHTVAYCLKPEENLLDTTIYPKCPCRTYSESASDYLAIAEQASQDPSLLSVDACNNDQIDLNNKVTVQARYKALLKSGIYSNQNTYTGSLDRDYSVGGSFWFVVNPDPEIADGEGKLAQAWVDNIISLPNPLGLYFDNFNAYDMEMPNYRREHFQYADSPLGVGVNNRAVIFQFASTAELLKSIKAKVNQSGKYLLANLHTWNTGFNAEIFLAPYLDVLGSETGNIGLYANSPNLDDEHFALHRTITYTKPYVLLIYPQTADLATSEKRKKIAEWALSYGIFPGDTVQSGINFWEDGDWYKPLVAINKEINYAGWQPLTYAETEEGAKVERFGNSSNKVIYFTIRDSSASSLQEELKISATKLGINNLNNIAKVELAYSNTEDLIDSTKMENDILKIQLPTLSAESTAVVKIMLQESPTPTPTPLLTQTPSPSCLEKATRGDYDCDGEVNLHDFDVWESDYLEGKTTLSFFEYWRRAFFLRTKFSLKF